MVERADWQKTWKSGYGFRRDDRDWTFCAPDTDRQTRFWNAGRWVADQQLTSACVGCAWAHWLTCAPVITWLDPFGIYDLAKYVDEWRGEDYEGTSVRAGAKILKWLGLIAEYSFAKTVTEVCAAVADHGPVVAGIPWLEDMFDPNPAGKIFATGQECGGHAVLIDGVDTVNRYFRLKSSYGPAWGLNGHARLDFDDLGRLLELANRQYELCVAVPREPEPMV